MDAIATYRLVRLAQRDHLPPVEHARHRLCTDGPAWVAELLDCPWCLSFWVALGVIAARRFTPRLWRPLALALTYSAVTGFITEQE